MGYRSERNNTSMATCVVSENCWSVTTIHWARRKHRSNDDQVPAKRANKCKKDIYHQRNISLVGGFTPSEKYEFVNWDDEFPNIWKNNPVMFQEHHQPESDL